MVRRNRCCKGVEREGDLEMGKSRGHDLYIEIDSERAKESWLPVTTYGKGEKEDKSPH
jgi:hypothetical protein